MLKTRTLLGILVFAALLAPHLASRASGYGGYVIPERDFRLQFGPERGFRLHARPVIRQGYPCFAWGGYSFLIVDPWPETWTETWYAEDDLWIAWEDGYYLHSRRHPGFGLALTVTF